MVKLNTMFIMLTLTFLSSVRNYNNSQSLLKQLKSWSRHGAVSAISSLFYFLNFLALNMLYLSLNNLAQYVSLHVKIYPHLHLGITMRGQNYI